MKIYTILIYCLTFNFICAEEDNDYSIALSPGKEDGLIFKFDTIDLKANDSGLNNLEVEASEIIKKGRDLLNKKLFYHDRPKFARLLGKKYGDPLYEDKTYRLTQLELVVEDDLAYWKMRFISLAMPGLHLYDVVLFTNGSPVPWKVIP